MPNSEKYHGTYYKKPINGLTIMKFGKYKGYMLKDIPTEYFQYLLDHGICFKGIKHYCKDILKLKVYHK